jgi:hypothetical protein
MFSRILRWLSVKKNRDVVAFVGGGVVIAAGGLWTVVTFFWPAQTPNPNGSGGNGQHVVIGGDNINSPINLNRNDTRSAPAPAQQPQPER